MENLNFNLEKAKLICNGEIKLDKEHKIDSFTPINLSGYFRFIDLNNKSLLTVGNSSDEVLNGAFYGAKRIDLYDSNILTKYYYYLKIAGLSTLSYKEFEWFFYKYMFNHHPNNKMFSKKLYKKIKPELINLDKDSYYFFTELFDKYNNRVVRDNLFNDTGYHKKALRFFDIYLTNEITYGKTIDNIKNVDFNFYNKDILTSEIKNKYDVINLSSLCTKISLYKLVVLLKKLDNNNLLDNGTMILAYLWKNNMYTEEYKNIWKKIYEDPSSNKILDKYISEILDVSSYRDILWEDNQKEEKVLVYHKK